VHTAGYDGFFLLFFLSVKANPIYQSESPFVIFTDDPAKRFEDFATADLVRADDNLGIKYEKDEIFEDTVILLRYNCPDRDCDTACFGWPDLHRHVKSKHGKSMW
jgi:ribosome assembly protein 4